MTYWPHSNPEQLPATEQRTRSRRSKAEPPKDLLTARHDLQELLDWLPEARAQLDPRSARPVRSTPDKETALRRIEEHGRQYREARDEQITYAGAGDTLRASALAPSLLGAATASADTGALDALAFVESILLELADEIGKHHRRTQRQSAEEAGRTTPRAADPADYEIGDHRLVPPATRPRGGALGYDLNGYDRPVRLGLGGRGLDALLEHISADAGATITHVARWLLSTGLHRIEADPVMLKRAAVDASTAARAVRQVVGLPELYVLLDRPCFVCGEMSLRLWLGRELVECRNPDCDPSERECGQRGRNSEPQWPRNEFGPLSDRLGIDLEERVRNRQAS